MMRSLEVECSRERVADLVKLLIRYQASYALIPRPGGGETKRRIPVDQLKRVAEQLVLDKTHHHHHGSNTQGPLKTMLDSDLIELIVRRASKAWERVLLPNISKREKEEEAEEVYSSTVNTPNPEISIL